MYGIVKLLDGEAIMRTNEDGTTSWIPLDENNADYQTYLATLDE